MADYLRASDGIGEPVRAIVVSERETGAVEINVDSVLNWPNKFIATSGMIDPLTGTFDPATVTVFYGHLSGSYIEIEQFAPGYADLGNQENEIIVLKPTTPWADKVSDAIQNIETVISDFDKKVFLASHPVGSTYWNGIDDRNPGTVYGGTWEAIPGAVLGGISESPSSPFYGITPNTNIGSHEVTLTEAQMPSHRHNTSGYYPYTNPVSNWWFSNSGTSGSGGTSRVVKVDATDVGVAESNTVTNTGGSKAHPNIQVTRVGYLWIRMA